MPYVYLPERASASPYDSTSTPIYPPSTGYVGYQGRRINRIPPPVPVPHLIKKSRGRIVPTPPPGGGGGGPPNRPFICGVKGCGKGFVRGEHLKRHVRGIHTWEKPYECLYDGCGKTFSRRDNLAQHSRVHLPG
ncbi:hypothetical protein DFH06DRAFT_1022153 [Mycena polygramma]|nr:hypothetical protein DFH06DRAFT_1022153 [Mycena polygramma]